MTTNRISPVALPFKEAIEFWKGKIKLSTEEYYALSDEARARAFAVSGITKTDELETIYDSLDRAIEGKVTFADFKKDVGDIAAKRGLKTYRLENIFRTNVQSAYMAGRWSQVQKSKKFRPYAIYSAVRDKLTRAVHYALHGKIFPVDHPFWDTWWGPNGFKCRCGARTLSERQVKARGLKVETKDITGDMVIPVKKDGTKLLPVNLLPDPGFARNAAKDYFGGIVEKAVSDSKGLKEIKQKAATLKPIKTVKKETYNESHEVESDVLDEPVINPKKTEFSESNSDISIIKNPSEVWLVPHRTKKGRVKLVKRYIAKWKGKNCIAEVVGGVLIRIKELSGKSLDEKRRGLLLWTS